ncbi:hypothetical protein EW145_g3835 [Phellinidium pouzarii]|uniref:Pentacotripeptide-repeat region of PRORP domain-containing protein n=1 Tax=Phellinidium pouzarii TaxID=167371 RepID=A0A4S4LAW7_9AGAM|nr:hypothetical protein EW145_g3835 [Phellinidium pouzarii]
MLKASASGIVLAPVIHSDARNVVRRAIINTLCPRLLQSRSSSFSTSQPVVNLDVATSLAQAPFPENMDTTFQSYQIASMSGSGSDWKKENGKESLEPYGQLKQHHFRYVAQARIKRGTRRRAEDTDFSSGMKEGRFPSKGKGKTGRRHARGNLQVVNSKPGLIEHAKVESIERQKMKGVLSSNSKRSTKSNLQNGRSSKSLAAEPLSDVYRLKGVILRKSSTLEEAWDAFQDLVTLDGASGNLCDTGLAKHQELAVEENVLKCLAVRISKTKPSTRGNFLRLLSVSARLRRERERRGDYPLLRTEEWNSLIHFAGSGLRRTTVEAYNAALDVFSDMMRDEGQGHEESKSAKPSIYTFTTLLSIAVRTDHRPAIEHAMEMLRMSRLKPTRITHLCTIRFHLRTEGLPGVRRVMSILVKEGHEVGIDGVTTFLYCAGLEGQVEVVQKVYAALRQNLRAVKDVSARIDKRDNSAVSGMEMSHRATRSIEHTITVEGVTFSKSLIPSETTYTCTIQTLAYHGYMIEAMEVFKDMLSTERPAPESGSFQPSYSVFRAFFLGYAKHGCQLRGMSKFARKMYLRQTAWNWERLQVLLDAFLELKDCNPSGRVIYWIMKAVRRTTGSEELLQDVWMRLNTQFRFRKGGRLSVLDKRYSMPESNAK